MCCPICPTYAGAYFGALDRHRRLPEHRACLAPHHLLHLSTEGRRGAFGDFFALWIRGRCLGGGHFWGGEAVRRGPLNFRRGVALVGVRLVALGDVGLVLCRLLARFAAWPQACSWSQTWAGCYGRGSAACNRKSCPASTPSSSTCGARSERTPPARSTG